VGEGLAYLGGEYKVLEEMGKKIHFIRKPSHLVYTANSREA